MLKDIYIALERNHLWLSINNKYTKTFFELTAMRDMSLRDGINGFLCNTKNSEEIIT